ncbi:MAG: T9SS type A sorting domain-containing protein, partial [Thermoflexibacter sp.]|nr:T9SS type A sorting domain-containing protein [Thermoflexibacter sp.]
INGASSSDRATLELGTGTDVVVSPLTYSNASLPANIARPITNAADPVTANVATTFPYFTNTIGNFVAGVANTGKMNLQTFSTVIFNAGTTQQVLGGFTYGNITLRSPGTTMAPLINKTIVRDMSSPLPFNLDIAGDLRLEEWNNFIDDGWQINGRANKTYTALANSQLTIGINDVGTQFPTAYTNPNIILDATNLTVYNAGHLANMSMLPHQIMSTVPTYGSLTLRDPTAVVGSTDLIEKRFDPPSPVGVKGDITIERHNHLNDNGSQISRLTAGGVLTMEDGWATVMGLDSSQVTRLTLGSATSATTLPLNFTTTLLNDNTTVVYSSGITQLVAGGARLNGMPPNSYFNLWLQSLPAATAATKNLEGAITVRNDLVIRQNIRFNDANDDASPTNAFQITGSATGNMTMEANSELRLNKANTATSTVFPTNFIRTNIGLNLSSKVIYNSNVAQDVSSLPLYGSVIMRKFTPIAPLVPKTVTTVRSNLDVRGDSLKIEAYNHLIDNGVQIDGTATGFMFMDYRSQLTLGTPMTATSFPTDFLSERINMDSWLDYPSNMMLRPKTDMSFVIYNSDLPQLISAASPVMGSVGPGKATSFSTLEKSSWYGNVRLSSTAAVTKTLENNVNIRGGLYIDGNNTLEVTTNHYDIYLGGDWEAAANSDFLARQGRVILDGIDRTQNITTDAAPFYEIEIDKPGTNRTAILLDQLRLTHRAVYKAGYFISSPTREFIYDVNANHSTEAGTGTEYGDADARTNGPSSLSHVFGPVTKIGVNNINTFYFPIGNTSVYAPAGIRAPAGTNNATTITARYFGFNSGLMGIDTAPCPSIPLTNISTAEYWTLDAPGGTTAPTGIQVTLSWSAIRSGGVTNSSLLRVAHYYNGGTGLKWYCEGRDAANSPDKASVNPFEGGVVASDNVNITTFSPFTLGSLNPVNPLPIQLIKFEAKAIEEQKVVELRWQTAREINNDFFVLEKSKDGKNFIAFKNVPSKNGNSTVTNDYLEIDQEPISGLSYYRLKQVDNDGTYTYSKIIPVYFADENADGGMILYPNPTESDINLQIFDIDLSEGYISISDMLGREIHSEFIEGISPEKSLPIRLKQNLASGAYILKFVGKSKSYVKSFIVNK